MRCHDLHHVLTEYPCTPFGEIEMGTWEFAAAEQLNWRGWLFYLPFLVLGAVLCPSRMTAAFRRGRGSSTLYAVEFEGLLLDARVDDLRAALLPASDKRPQ